MNTREQILQSVRRAGMSPLPHPGTVRFENPANWEAFSMAAQTAGARVVPVSSQEDILQVLQMQHAGKRILSTVPGRESIAEAVEPGLDPHTLADVQAVVLQGRFGVAENGAIWLQESDMVLRALPFICQHLYILIRKEDIVADLHAAYERIGADDYSFGLFLCGPSKTADIEQSLVLGAHGARTLTVFTGGFE